MADYVEMSAFRRGDVSGRRDPEVGRPSEYWLVPSRLQSFRKR